MMRFSGLFAAILGLFLSVSAANAQTVEESRAFAQMIVNEALQTESAAFLEAREERFPGTINSIEEFLFNQHQQYGDAGAVTIANNFGYMVQRMVINTMLSARDADIIAFQRVSNRIIAYMADNNPRLCRQAAGGSLAITQMAANVNDPAFRALAQESSDAMAVVVRNAADEPRAVDQDQFNATNTALAAELPSILTTAQQEYLQGIRPVYSEEQHSQFCQAVVAINDYILSLPSAESSNYYRTAASVMASAQ